MIPNLFFNQKYLKSKSIRKALPIVPNNLLEAFEYGEIVHAVQEAEKQNDQQTIEFYLNKVKIMSERDEVTIEELYSMKAEIMRMVDKKSVFDRVWGFFTFVNIMWFIAILGIAVTLIPTITYFFGDVLSKMLFELLLPVALWLHTWCFFELLVYFICN